MAEESFNRKLTAILSADVEGYSRLMRDDEEATVRDLAAHRVLITEIIKQHNGRVIDSPGDNILAEFASVVEAVNGALKIQEEIRKSNTGTPEDRRMEFRIGINLGDVIEEEARIYGDGVNIAARVEGMAAAGGIAISGTVFEHIKDKLSLGYHYLGEQDVKNIPEPIHVYQILTKPEEAGKVIGTGKPKASKWRLAALGALAFIILLAGTLVIWNYYLRVQIKPALLDKIAFPSADKPSIAVLPFNNLSDDPEQEYFADGMTDDLITALSKISGILVISRNSVFTFKGKPVKMEQIAEELNVQYVVEGSIRRVGETIRVNAQLINANTDHHLWAEKYDSQIEDIFSVQDNITQKIVSALSVTLTNKEQALLATTETNNIQAYDLFLKGRSLKYEETPDSYAEAVKLLKKAVELDPNFSLAFAELADAYWWAASFGFQFWKPMGIRYYSGRNLGISYLNLAMKNPTPKAHNMASHVAISRRQFQTAVDEALKAIALSPNDSEGYKALSWIYKDSQPKVSISYAKAAMKIDPQNLSFSLWIQGVAHFFMKNYEKAVEFIERSFAVTPEVSMDPFLPAAYAYLGQDQEADRTYKLFLKAFRGLSAPIPEHVIHIHGIQEPEKADLLINGLIKAGLPSQPGQYCRLSNDEKLSVEEVKELVSDKAWTGYYWMRPDKQWWKYWSKDGISTHKMGGRAKKRDFGFENDKFYCVVDVRGRKIKQYWAFYRNPHGTYEQKNEYVQVHENFVGPFSVEKQP
jgi:adenylate cyclase